MERLQKFALLVVYQFTLLAGILLLPVALLTERLGLRLPIDRMVTGLKRRYEQTTHN
jgi:type IV secretory pathway TrbL component